MTDSPKRIYWDACAWIGLIMGESKNGRAARCEHLIDEARKGNLQIWTSSLTHAEVYKRKCDGADKTLQPDKDRAFEDYLEQEFVYEVALDHDIGSLARALLRTFSPPLKKPNDAVHLATAAFNNVNELHTFDGDNLLPLDGKIKKRDGTMLKICEVPEPPSGTQIKLDISVPNEQDKKETGSN